MVINTILVYHSLEFSYIIWQWYIFLLAHNLLIMGDFNMKSSDPFLTSLCHSNSLTNLVKNNIRFKGIGSCIDLILTKKKYYFENIRSFDQTGLTYNTSDNETPPISRVMIDPHVIFCWLMSPPCWTRLENVRQSNIKKGKKIGFQLSHKHPP